MHFQLHAPHVIGNQTRRLSWLSHNPTYQCGRNSGHSGDISAFERASKIAAFLRTETAKLDALIAEAQSAIDLLQERRTALISAAVTGKIDVRGLVAAAPLAPETTCA